MSCLPGRVEWDGGLAKDLPVGVSVSSVLLRNVLKSSQSLECQCWMGIERLSNPVFPKLVSSEPWGSPVTSLGRRGAPALGTAAPLLSAFSMWVLGGNFSKMQTLSCLCHRWLLIVLEIKIKTPTSACREGPALCQPPRAFDPHHIPAVPGSQCLRRSHALIHPHCALLWANRPASAHPGKPILVPQGGPASCHSQPTAPGPSPRVRSLPGPTFPTEIL